MSTKKYTDNKLVVFGAVGAALTALCCFTPLLVWGLAALGAVALGAYLDYVLLPLLVIFIAVTYVGIQQVRKHRVIDEEDCCDVPPAKPTA